MTLDPPHSNNISLKRHQGKYLYFMICVQKSLSKGRNEGRIFSFEGSLLHNDFPQKVPMKKEIF